MSPSLSRYMRHETNHQPALDYVCVLAGVCKNAPKRSTRQDENTQSYQCRPNIYVAIQAEGLTNLEELMPQSGSSAPHRRQAGRTRLGWCSHRFVQRPTWRANGLVLPPTVFGYMFIPAL